MAKFLPFGREIIATDEQIQKRDVIFEQYEMYGIPYGVLDATCGEGKRTEIEKDREAARLLIMQGRDIPQDLRTRLIQYKNESSDKERNISFKK